MRGILVLALLSTGCGKDDEDVPMPEVAVATYNAGLATGFVDGAESRGPLVADAVAALDADVVCLQEVWTPEQVALVTDAADAAGTFPHRLFPDPMPVEVTGEVACEAGELDGVFDCLDTSCGDACVDDLADCLLASCAIPFLGLSPGCQGCAMAQVGQDLDVARSECESKPTAYAYGAGFGTGILSRHPITSTEEVVFPSSINRRGALHAVVDVEGVAIDVYCTHLTPDFGILPYPKPEGSWIEEQQEQIDLLRAFVDETSSGPVVLLGDFNTGPELDGVTAELPDSWEQLSAGYQAPYVDQVGDCTLCGDNPLHGADSLVIDHVLLKGAAEASAERILDEPITAESCGEPIDAALSDHYGVRVTFVPEGPVEE